MQKAVQQTYSVVFPRCFLRLLFDSIDFMLLRQITKEIKLIKLYISVALTFSLCHCFLAKKACVLRGKKKKSFTMNPFQCLQFKGPVCRT